MSIPKLSDYQEVVGRNVIDELYTLANHVGSRSIKMVNSTAVGGGVAEMLHRIVPLLNELGVKTNWDVIKGGGDFFDITKAFHNALQGKPDPFDDQTFQTYLSYNEMNNDEMVFDEDLIVIHDPQPAAIVQWHQKQKRKNKWVWRCHIDLSNPNQQLWKFLKRYVNMYDAAIFSSPLFSPQLDIPQYQFFPAIDPLADKNRELSQEYINSVTEKYKILTDKPIVCQISRYDPWKDPVGVIKAYRMARKYVDCRLLMVGDKAADDPEAEDILRQVNEAVDNDPEIKIIFLTNSIPTEINAFQRTADIILQKSIREGFALTVSEALWKYRPVIGGAVGGIPVQIIHNYTGMLVHSVEGAALQIRNLLSQADLAKRLGENGRQRVKSEFLILSLLRRYLLLLLALDQPEKSSLFLQ